MKLNSEDIIIMLEEFNEYDPRKDILIFDKNSKEYKEINNITIDKEGECFIINI